MDAGQGICRRRGRSSLRSVYVRWSLRDCHVLSQLRHRVNLTRALFLRLSMKSCLAIQRLSIANGSRNSKNLALYRSLDAFDSLSPTKKLIWSRAVDQVDERISEQIALDEKNAVGWTTYFYTSFHRRRRWKLSKENDQIL